MQHPDIASFCISWGGEIQQPPTTVKSPPFIPFHTVITEPHAHTHTRTHIQAHAQRPAQQSSPARLAIVPPQPCHTGLFQAWPISSIFPPPLYAFRTREKKSGEAGKSTVACYFSPPLQTPHSVILSWRRKPRSVGLLPETWHHLTFGPGPGFQKKSG